MDFWVVYNAFLLNVPLPQEYFDHTGYLSILLLSYWRAPCTASASSMSFH